MRKTTPAHFLALALVGLVSASAQAGWLDDLQKKLGISSPLHPLPVG
jgi:hypothetical protein